MNREGNIGGRGGALFARAGTRAWRLGSRLSRAGPARRYVRRPQAPASGVFRLARGRAFPRRKIRLLREFDHPGILSVTDAGEWRGRPFYVMPDIDGESLQDRPPARAPPPAPRGGAHRGALVRGVGVCAHAEGRASRREASKRHVVRGRGVPDGLRDRQSIGARRRVVAQHDWGSARDDARYMSPEQADCRPSAGPSQRHFQFGLCALRDDCRQNPYQSADETRMLLRRMTDEPDPLSRHRDGVPEGLEQVVMKALAREPADRWQGVGEMGVGLRRGDPAHTFDSGSSSWSSRLGGSSGGGDCVVRCNSACHRVARIGVSTSG